MMEDVSMLEKVDAVRARFNVTYEEALAALNESNGDVMQALIALERKENAWTEKISVSGGELVTKIKEIIHQGNVRRVVVKQDDRVLFEVPLMLGALGAIIAPQLAAIGAIAALVTKCTIEIEHVGPKPPTQEEQQP
jgi:hypothetical protein